MTYEKKLRMIEMKQDGRKRSIWKATIHAGYTMPIRVEAFNNEILPDTFEEIPTGKSVPMIYIETADWCDHSIQDTILLDKSQTIELIKQLQEKVKQMEE